MEQGNFLRISKEKKDNSRVELIEHGQIILVTQLGTFGYDKGLAGVQGVLHFLDQATHTTHLISDMTNAKLLEEAEVLIQGDALKRLENHPMLGVSTMVVRTKQEDAVLDTIMSDYNIKTALNRLHSPDGEYKRNVLMFSAVEEAKHFLLQYNQTWNILGKVA